MYDAVLVPTPKYVPPSWETTDLGEFVQYDPKFFEVWQIPETQRLGLRCIRPKGKIPQPVGLTDYGYMFADSRIGSLDMTGWDFSEVKSLAAFLMNCKRMDKIKCDGLNLKKCVDFHRCFYNCDGLDGIDINSWDLDEVSIFNEVFAECTNLVYCLCSNLNVMRLDETTGMYENCVNLRELDLSGWFTPDLNNANRMCKGCKKLRFADIRFTNVKGLRDMDEIFMDCVSLKKVIMPDLTESENCSLYLAFDGTPLSVRPKEYIEYMEKRKARDKENKKNEWF